MGTQPETLSIRRLAQLKGFELAAPYFVAEPLRCNENSERGLRPALLFRNAYRDFYQPALAVPRQCLEISAY